MKIKIRRREFNVGTKDRILDNGHCYMLITQKCFDNYYWVSPTVPKTLFNKFLKNGDIQMSKKKYKTGYSEEMDLYEFTHD